MDKTARKSFQTEVDSHLCKACGYCREMCPVKVFEPSGQLNAQGYDYMMATHSKKCIGCLRCIMICPDFAVIVKEQT